ncbi:serine hydrolase domain-containing protein [Streptomyces litchfieldiae]|uniref:Serine hydrolase domain-containing protein n=1 Tax=Streptomyces litchfieldiae TaxID=3075543 RepID=A0ABU2MV84_9ACTN|nr:serine hydrolase domain-containing protein [Streptomyces sp. DSM 44938]MDT0345312.1 serine hydrolase domain-containing protein [Streptomyces sp. DSM 44938]
MAAGAEGVAAVLTTPDGAEATDTRLSAGAHYRAGSTTKAFLATVVLQLVGEGRLSLADPVCEPLPGVVTGNGHDGCRVTLRQLLQHTSGLPDYTAVPGAFPVARSPESYRAHRFDHRDPAGLVAAALTRPPAFAPGTGFAYSNTNYLLAGMIVERVTGRSWRAEVTDRVIRPLGLTGTFLPGDDPALPAPYARGRETFPGGDRPTDTTLLNGTAAGAAGELVTTARDLNRFLTALLGGELLAPAELAAMRDTRPVPGAPGHGYGLGLAAAPLSCGGSYWHHDGTTLGFTGANGVTADGTRAVTVWTNGHDSADPARQARVEAAMRALVDHALCGD